MKLKAMLAATLLLCTTTAGAAFYLPLGDGGKLTMSNDMTTAVLVTKDSYIRYKFSHGSSDQIDNDGRPYNLISLIEENCKSMGKCSLPALVLKIFMDKQGGVEVSNYDAKKNKKYLIRTVPDSEIAKD